MMALCAAAYLWGRPERTGAVLVSALGHAAVAVAVIWAFYGFRYSAFNPSLPSAYQFIESWGEMYSHTGWEGRVVHFLAGIHALPEAFLYGAAYVVQTRSCVRLYLNPASTSVTGWPSYFLWTFAGPEVDDPLHRGVGVWGLGSRSPAACGRRPDPGSQPCVGSFP